MPNDPVPGDGTRAYVLEDQVGHLLRRASQRHIALFSELFADTGLTALQFAVIMKLQEHGELSQNRLGRLTAMDPNTVQGVVKRLQKRELIERRPNPADRRRIILALSPAGAALAIRLVDKGFQISDDTLSPLSPREAEAFLALLRRLT
ncbi:MAG: MarR family transcriptional regulator [Gammaproteobacteria bacterium]|nr:MarR family transcriptional regulator [Gammaproteobacteria bacterium]